MLHPYIYHQLTPTCFRVCYSYMLFATLQGAYSF